MVDFTQITFDDKWIYALAEDCTEHVFSKIKVSRAEDYCEFEYRTLDIARAVWALVDRVNDGELKQNSATSVAWG